MSFWGSKKYFEKEYALEIKAIRGPIELAELIFLTIEPPTSFLRITSKLKKLLNWPSMIRVIAPKNILDF